MISLEGVDHVLPRVRQKLTVVLDLDECLVHSVFPNGDKYRQSEARPENINLVDSMHLVLGGVEPVVVNRRPGLTKFLEQLSVDYHVVVFTAGRKEYAEEVLDAIDPQGTFFHHRLYRCSCRQARGNIYLKDLDRPVGEALERTVLVDNSPLSFICQPSNGILVSSWYDDPHDNALSSVLKLIRHLDACDDVRPTLTALFGLEPVLKEYQEVSAPPTVQLHL
ncbi:putative CTD small phosphatase-like protein [Tribonema minus]|uniref:Putative CTD small phosphatase-like protein n=1 Tax=Tribonema minus TaxID=303371 RepID=A0A836CB86_9STRA|nr:putative CTD small phosphatase-like protein [Tribonema minus]